MARRPWVTSSPSHGNFIHANLTDTPGYNVGADLFTYYAGMADKIHGETSYPSSAGKYKITQREPIGVCSGIGAWNVSAVLFAWKAAVSLKNLPVHHDQV